MAEPLLEVRNLTKDFPAGWDWSNAIPRRQFERAVDNVSFDIGVAEAFGLVGESGCGKTTTARMIMRLIEPTSGHVTLDGENLVTLPSSELFKRRRLFQVVFQNPYASLDPRWTVEAIVSEPLRAHEKLSKEALRRRVLDLLSTVALGHVHLDRYPHQLSGGQRQRVAIARALALNPRLLVADEPTSALDVSIQAKILNFLMELREEFRLGLLLISHNLAVIHHLCDRVGVMYYGRIVELGSTEQVLKSPGHPYTQVLVSAILDPKVKSERIVARGDVPAGVLRTASCPFFTRCPIVQEVCRNELPPEVVLGEDHVVHCHLVKS